MKHKTKRICLKMIDVDIGIIPIVQWLNSFKSIYTLYSCQGEENNRPYVMFISLDDADLNQILRILSMSGEWTVETTLHKKQRKYTLRFSRVESLLILKERIAIHEGL